MIDWKQSAELNGCTIEWLKARFIRFPNSGKRIIAICDGCGNSRNLKFQDYRDHSDLCYKCKFNTPEEKKLRSERAIKRFSNPIEILKLLNRWSDPKYCRMMSLSRINSDAAKNASKIQRGGYDIVVHHWLYDDADLSKYTMPMTRSDHGKMHARMRSDGYEVPHINSDTDDNGLWGYR